MIRPISLRPEPELREQLEEIALRDDRSLNKTIIIILRKAISDMGSSAGGEA